MDAETNRPFHDILRAFERRTGCGLVINTSFNVRGEPIVCTPEDAYRCFMGVSLLRIRRRPQALRDLDRRGK